MSRRISSPIFIGRRPELERLDTALKAATAGQPSLLLVAGEAGVGKTRLLSEFASRAEADGVRMLIGGCLDVGEGGLPFGPFTEALKGLANTLGREAITSIFGSSGPALAGLISNIDDVMAAGATVTSPNGQASRQVRVFDAVLDVLGRLSAASPVLLILEDLHWADGSTRDLLRFLMRNLHDERILLVASFRNDDLHRRHPLMPLLSELERSDRVDRLKVSPFARAEIIEQLTAIGGVRPAGSVIDRVTERSDGLPFYIEELVAADATGGVIPESLRDILTLRLGSLSDVSLALVRAAAVIGGTFALDRLTVVAGVAETALLEALRGAIEARVLVSVDHPDNPGYGFRHALMREAAYEDLLPAERARLHARLADHLDAVVAGSSTVEPGLIADLAVHAYHSGNQPRAFAAAVRAIRVLAEAGAYPEALVHAERALELWPHVLDAELGAGMSHGDLLSVAGRVAANAGRPDPALAHAAAALEELETSASLERLAERLADLYYAAYEAEAFDTAWAAARRLDRLVDELPVSRLQAYALIIVADQRWSTGHIGESLALLQRSMATAKALNDDGLWVVVARETALSLASVGRVGQAEALIDAAAAASTGFDGTFWPFLSVGSCGFALWLAGRFEDSLTFAADAQRTAIRYGVEGRHHIMVNAAHALLELGRLDEAEEHARSAGEHRYSGLWTVIAKAQVLRGHLNAARLASQPAVAWNSPLWKLEIEVFLERAAGNFDRVHAAVDEAEEECAKSDLVSPMWLLLGTAIGAAADHAVTARQRRQPAEAASAVELGHDWLGRLRQIVDDGRAHGGAGAFCEATLATAEGEIKRLKGVPDPAAWRTAASDWRAISHPCGTAYAELRLAEALLETNEDRTEVARLLRDAHVVATDLGAAPLRKEIEMVARHAKVKLVDEPSPGASGIANVVAEPTTSPLTARERDVLRLVAAGHTNREIGDQ
ncbi:MAG: AAA family ATPase, partial [Chloroflexota bacterium]